MWAAANDHFLVLEFLLERGADIQAKSIVSDRIIIEMKSHIRHMTSSVNKSEWIHTINIYSKTWSFITDEISVGERSSYGGEDSCK